VGVAVWLRPRQRTRPLGVLWRSGQLFLPLSIGLAPSLRALRFGHVVDSLHERSVTSRHWYLQQVSVDPELQGRGLGRRLLDPQLKAADAEGISCYLDTEKPVNLDIYARFGFDTVSEAPAPDGRSTIWGMLRPPGG
jgi:ribosomal protein S18 acetylase RimI-like enzyme